MPPVRVAAGVIERDGRILVCRRLATGRHPLQWEFPGGKLEAGESYTEGLVRELREELGIETIAGDEIARTRHAYPGGVEVEVVFFVARIAAGEPRNLCFEEICWCRPAELPSLDFVAADVDVVRRIARHGLAPGSPLR